MPIAVVTKITRPEHLVPYLAELIRDNLPEIKYVSQYDENLIPDYPCVQVQPGDLSRELHGTHTFMVYMRALIYVMHDRLTETKMVRSENELKLVTKVVDLLHSDLTFGGRVIDGFISDESPDILPPRTQKGDIVVSTRIGWVGKNEIRFK